MSYWYLIIPVILVLGAIPACTKKQKGIARPSQIIKVQVHPDHIRGQIQKQFLDREDAIRKCHKMADLPQGEIVIEFRINKAGIMDYAKVAEELGFQSKPKFKACLIDLIVSMKIIPRADNRGLPAHDFLKLYF